MHLFGSHCMVVHMVQKLGSLDRIVQAQNQYGIRSWIGNPSVDRLVRNRSNAKKFPKKILQIIIMLYKKRLKEKKKKFRHVRCIIHE